VTGPSYVRGADEQLLDRTIGEELGRAAADHPGAEAIVSIHQGVRLTYSELVHRADRVATALRALGVERGDRVGIWSANRWEWAAVQYGTARIGAILVNVNPAYRSHELGFALRQAGISVLVTAPAFRSTDYLPMLDEVLPEAPQTNHVVLLDPLAGAASAPPDWAMPWHAFLERGHDEISAEAAADLDPDDPINIQFTSGTTGRPKGATLTHRNVLNNGWFVGERLRLLAETLASELEIVKLERKIEGQVRSQVHKNQKEFYLNEQLKAIRKELGHQGEFTNEIEELAVTNEPAHAKGRHPRLPCAEEVPGATDLQVLFGDHEAVFGSPPGHHGRKPDAVG